MRLVYVTVKKPGQPDTTMLWAEAEVLDAQRAMIERHQCQPAVRRDMLMIFERMRRDPTPTTPSMLCSILGIRRTRLQIRLAVLKRLGIMNTGEFGRWTLAALMGVRPAAIIEVAA